MDHLGIGRFMVIGYCIAQPVGFREESKDTKERIPLAVRHVRTFRQAHRAA
jgi:hypothetical protein